MNQILLSAEKVIKKSGNIFINEDNIDFFCQNNIVIPNLHWLDYSPINIRKMEYKEQLTFILLLNSISCCFWSLPKWTIKHKGNILDGSWGLVAALSKSIEKKIPILDFKFLKDITIDDFNNIIEDHTNKMALKKERVSIIRNIANNMCEKFGSSVENLLYESEYDATNLCEIIVENFKQLEDYSIYDNEIIIFNKKAQLITADFNFVLKLNGKDELKNISDITACADYKIPFILREFGIIEYSEHLKSLVDHKLQLEHGSKEEIEIRAFTIWTVELIRRKYEEMGITAKPCAINDFLWIISQVKYPHYKPYHRTLTTCY